MVAYSFKRRFVAPILVGLGYSESALFNLSEAKPKRQTIRAERRKRHARPGEELQLYCAMRTKSCILIGRARCTDAQPIRLYFARPDNRGILRNDSVRCAATGWLQRAKQLDAFARSDGFEDWNAMRAFWDEEHDGIREFEGHIIFWEPLQ